MSSVPVPGFIDKNVAKVLPSLACLSNCVSQCQDNSPAKVVITGQLKADRSDRRSYCLRGEANKEEGGSVPWGWGGG